MKRMDRELWKNLPHELHASILQYFTVPQFCRLRVVCRVWNDFGLTVQPRSMYIFKAPHFIHISSITIRNRLYDDKKNEEITNKVIKDLLQESSEVFDPSTQKVYSINMEFLSDGVRSRFAFLDRCQIMAANRGFVFVLWSDYFGIMQVANPITRSVIDIPPIYEEILHKNIIGAMVPPIYEEILYKNMIGAMTVMEDYSSFTLYVLFTVKYPEKSYLAQFDSQVGKWQEFPKLPETLTPSHMLKLNEMLYTIFREKGTNTYKMFALNTTLNTWTNMDVELPNYISKPQLATTEGRLFIIGFLDTYNKDNKSKIEFLEINIVSQYGWIATMMNKTKSKSLLVALDCFTMHEDYQGTSNNTAVVGYGDFIVLTSSTGQSIAYDLVNRDLRKWRSGRRISDLGNRDEKRYGVFAMPMTLTLNPVPLPQVQQPH